MPEPGSHQVDLGQLAQVFERFGTQETMEASPLYRRAILAAADNPELLELASHALHESVPLLFMAAIHYLLLKGTIHPLAAYYPTVSDAPSALDDDLIAALVSFCREHRAEIIHLMQTHLVQTNEVNRCILLLPGFEVAARQHPDRRLGIVEIGSSAGLNLLWDHYHYDYGNGSTWGPEDALLRLKTELRGHRVPPLPERILSVGFRLGLDLNPVDVRDADAALWLRALIWPEQKERAVRLQQAIAIVQQHPPDILSADVLEALLDVLNRVPDDVYLCVYHSFVVMQFSDAQRAQLIQLLTDHSQRRPVEHLSLEWLDTEHAQLEHRTYRDGALNQHVVLANCNAHGRWLEWLVSA